MENTVKKVLMVAYLFPPVGGLGAAGSQRVLKFVKYLPSHGWQPLVLTAKEDAYESYFSLDETLLRKLPADLPVHRTTVRRRFSNALRMRRAVLQWFSNLVPRDPPRAAQLAGAPIGANHSAEVGGRWRALKDNVTDLFQIPDGQMGWIGPAVREGARLIREQRIDAIFATGKPWSGLVVGAQLAKRSGLPLLSDFRDPWITNPFNTNVSPIKARLDTRLERSVVATSSIVIANTEELRTEFVQRFPDQSELKFHALMNGFDSDEFDPTCCRSTENRYFTILHLGFLYLKRDPSNLLLGVRRALDQKWLDENDLRIVQIGQVALPYDLMARASDLGLGTILSMRGELTHADALRTLGEADVLLLLQPGTTTQIPSKLFEYLMARRRILAVTPAQGATGRVVRSNAIGEVADAEDIEQIALCLRNLYRDWKASPAAMLLDDAKVSRFDVSRLSGDLAALLNSVCVQR
jgi:hypothetical protein